MDTFAESKLVLDKLQTSTTELREVVRLIQCEDIDSRVLRDFRGAVDHLQVAATAVQQWLENQAKQADPYIVLPTLAAARVRRTTLLARDLKLDLDTVEVGIETEGLENLYNAVEGLHRRLSTIFKRE